MSAVSVFVTVKDDVGGKRGQSGKNRVNRKDPDIRKSKLNQRRPLFCDGLVP